MTTTTSPYESRIVAWCLDCHHWVPWVGTGQRCDSTGCERKYVKRRMWVCARCGCASREIPEEHTHDDCY